MGAWKFVADNAIALCSLAVALFTGGFTAWQVMVQRKHNRLSVLPNLITESDSNIAFAISPEHGQIKLLTQRVMLRNVGLGSAHVKRFQAFLDGNPFDTTNQKLALASIRVLFGEECVAKATVFRFAAGYGIRAGDQVQVAEVVLRLIADGDADRHVATASRFDVLVEYESIYGDELTLDTRRPR